jgi:hypothetical protein
VTASDGTIYILRSLTFGSSAQCRLIEKIYVQAHRQQGDLISVLLFSKKKVLEGSYHMNLVAKCISLGSGFYSEGQLTLKG